MNLVLQGPDATPAQAAELAAMTRASACEALAAHAFRFSAANPTHNLAAWCESRRLDHAWVPAGRRFDRLKLLAMDMDSTLITIECIDELGAFMGRKAEIAAITEQAMRGEIDYAESLRRRVALLAGLEEGALEDAYDERLRLAPGAEKLIEQCHRHGVKLLLVSGGFAFFAERLRERLGLDETIANVLEVEGGRLTGRVLGRIVDAEAKAARFRQMAGRLGAGRGETLAIGDGANDLKMMAEAGVSVAFHAKPLVRASATHALDYSGLDGVIHLYE
ncbi:MAG TPA: phosphoserine phosphatase SerB [Burkholderiales bacterium]|nr:phosphoserine phosphatase SerB [Burkholderiales bacterium]